MRKVPYVCATLLAGSMAAYGQSNPSLSQRAVDLASQAKEGCVTGYGTMNLSDDGETRVEFRNGDASFGFEKGPRMFRFFTIEYFNPEEKERKRSEGNITRYLTVYPEDQVDLKLELPLKPKYGLGDLVIGPGRDPTWTAEYREHMKALLDALEKCK